MGKLKGSEMGRRERWDGSEVAKRERWESDKVRRWEVHGFIQGWGCRVSPRFHRFASDVNQGKKRAGWFQDFLV